MFITDASISFAKELLDNIQNTEKENAELEKKLTYYERRLKQFLSFRDTTPEGSSDEFYKQVYVGIEPDAVLLLEDAIVTLSKKVNFLKEDLESGKKQQAMLTDLFAKLTKVYPDLLVNLRTI